MTTSKKSSANLAQPPVCPYCQNRSIKISGAQLYPRRKDLAAKKFYRCHPCDAYVGTHPGTDMPLGRLANAALRALKMQAHAAFDPLWKSEGITRNAAYSALAKSLGIPRRDCHIGMFDEALCAQTIALCNAQNIAVVQ